METVSIQQQTTSEKATSQNQNPLVAICCLTIFPLIYLIGKTIAGLL